MCPEPNFGFQYRCLIEHYRLSPEISTRQRDTILERYFAGQRPARQPGSGARTASKEKGERNP